MKVKKLKAGESIEVGDRLCSDNWTGKHWFKVVRTTAKFAVVAWNEKSTARFPRVVDAIVRKCGDRDIWATTQYSFWRPVQDDKQESQG